MPHIIVCLMVFIMTGCSSISESNLRSLPLYVCDDDPDCNNKHILHEVSKKVSFPLNFHEQQALEHLQAKYDNEENIAGLAAPQIGYPYQIIIFAVDDPNLKKIRADFSDTMPRTIWLNPTYEGIGEKDSEDLEGCFSINIFVGKVKRFKSIKYAAYTVDGKQVSGTANGFLARVIQHEIDHVHGILCLDSVKEEDKINKQEYLEKRKKIMESQTA